MTGAKRSDAARQTVDPTCAELPSSGVVQVPSTEAVDAKTTTTEGIAGNALTTPETMVAASFQSDDSSDGYSLVDDDGDSLMGSENYVASEHESVSTSPESTADETPEEGGREEVEDLASIGNQPVLCGKIFLMIAVIIGTMAVSVSIYFSAHKGDVREFENAFDEAATSLSNFWRSSMLQHLGMMDALATSITSYSSIVGGAPWPLVAVPDFAELSANVREQVLLVPRVEDRGAWEEYALENLDWINQQQSRRLQDSGGTDAMEVQPTIFRINDESEIEFDDSNPPFSPVWQTYPVQTQLVNYNLQSSPQLRPAIEMAWNLKDVVLSESLVENSPVWNLTSPTVFTIHPFFDNFGSAREMAGVVSSAVPWFNFLDTTDFPTIAVVENTCDQSFSFAVECDDIVYLGVGNQHDTQYNSMGQAFDLEFESVEGTSRCMYTLRIYPTSKMEEAFLTNQPERYVIAVVVLAVLLLLAFCLYDCCVRSRHETVVAEAFRSRKIVTSLFPANVHDRLFKNNATPVPEECAREYKQVIANMATIEDGSNGPMHKGTSSIDAASLGNSSRSLGRLEPPMQRLRSFLSDLPAQSEHTSKQSGELKDEPIADCFSDCTVCFADISGFTAWSSVREPSQVFKLLETIYRSFDKLARKKKVFKVETVGDCYVAVTGLPEPQPDHAVIMARFAKECMQQMREEVLYLEKTLGPDTSELSMRFGLHSGPVTAGVLRGEKSRFQLFGDTVNFASRMETTGMRNRIQVSQATADLLIAAGKQDWVQPRDDLVNAKGLGHVQTFWIMPRRSNSGSSRSIGSMNSRSESCVKLKSKRKGLALNRESSSRRDMMNHASSRRSLLSMSQLASDIWTNGTKMETDGGDDLDVNRQERLIDWNVEILLGLLKRISAHREAKGKQESEGRVDTNKYKGQQALQEITEIIPLSDSGKNCKGQAETDMEKVLLHRKVEDQLREFVTMIACMYRDNPFHNFEHASHVLMSSQKLLNQVIKADQERFSEDTDPLSAYTCGITSDPLTQFAIVFSSLIHDVDHTGVPNSQLVKEDAHIASLYRNKSIAEQNSLDLSWDLLMDRNYRILQRAIFTDQAELERFRQICVNVVIATDIFDNDMKALRNSRWEKAFNGKVNPPLSDDDDISLKATIVIEYIMQASDVSHTMQHWHVYRRWNERLLEEMYSAYQVGRGEKDPSIGWYDGELWFFDNYIIPLARKLKECGVFGAASDVCLNYALENRREWAAKGKELVAAFVAKHQKSRTSESK